jgi:hypothetical protein
MVCNLCEKSLPSCYETIINHVGGLKYAKNLHFVQLESENSKCM